MTTRVIVQPEAEADICDAFRWYEAQRSDLGQQIVTALDRVLARIARRPAVPRLVHRDARRVALRRFPYFVLYVYRGDTVFVIGVIHERRSPKASITRVGGFRDGD